MFRKEILFDDIETDKDFDRWIKQGIMNPLQEFIYHFKMSWHIRTNNTIADALHNGYPKVICWLLTDRMYSNYEPRADIPWVGRFDTEEEALAAGDKLLGFDRSHITPVFAPNHRRTAVKGLLALVTTLLLAFTVHQVRADELGVGAEIVRPSETQASIYGDADVIAAMCAAITGIVATEIQGNAAKLRFVDATWWSQFTTEALIEEYQTNLREAAEEDWDRAWPIIVEGDLECHNLKAKALNESSE